MAGAPGTACLAVHSFVVNGQPVASLAMGYQPYRPDVSFAESVDAVFQRVLADCASAGHSPDQIQANLDVSGRTDQEVQVVRQRAAAVGLTAVLLVDDHVPARPGTVPRSTLGPLEASSMAEARAARILGDQGPPGVGGLGRT